MSHRFADWTVALLGLTAVAAAAFYAHGLEKIADPGQMKNWAIGCMMQLVMAPAVLALTRATSEKDSRRVMPWSARLMLSGVTIFSGTLYLMALGFPRWLGAVTPLGGLLLMLGWSMVAIEKK